MIAKVNLVVRPTSIFRRITVVAALSFIWTSALARGATSDMKHFSGDDLKADLQLLKKAYASMHPGLLRYHSAEQIDSSFAKTISRLASGATTPEAFVEFALLTAKVQCGHTYPNFFNQTSAVVDAVFRGQTRVPFYFTWIDHKMIVTRDLTPNHSLPAGTQVLELNGINAPSILAVLLPYIRADGANEAKRIALLGVSGESQWEAFDIYYPLVFHEYKPTLKLTIKAPDKASSHLTAQTMSDAEREAVRRDGRATGANDPVFTERALAKNIEVIRMASWGLFNSKWDWKTWLDSAIDRAVANRSPELILDIRGNEGGDDGVGRFIVSRLISNPLRIEDYARLVKYRSAPKELEPYLDTWDKSFLRLGADAKPFTATLPHLPPGIWYALESENSHAGTENIMPRKSRYTGRVVVLIDAQNSSATFQFADAVQQNHLGVLLGEPTGGNQRGINGGAFFFLRLPHTGIEVDLPLIGYFAQQDKPNSGLRPDVLVTTTIKDISSGNDPQIAAAVALAP